MTKGKQKGWTRGEERRATEWRGLGWTVSMIARQLARTNQAVTSRLNKLRVLRPHLVDDMVLLLQRPHSVRQLAGELGMSVSTVRAFKTRLKHRGILVWCCRQKKLLATVYPAR